MKIQNRKPSWGHLSLLVPLMLGLLLIDSYLKLSQLEHEFIEVGIVLLMYGSMACWLWVNQAALENETEDIGAWRQFDPKEGEVLEGSPMLVAATSKRIEQADIGVPALLGPQLLQILHSPVYHCAPPSGARLN